MRDGMPTGCMCEPADIYPDIHQIALVGIYTNMIYQTVIWELTPNAKNAVVNGPP